MTNSFVMHYLFYERPNTILNTVSITDQKKIIISTRPIIYTNGNEIIFHFIITRIL